MELSIKATKILRILLAKLGIYFSKQPAKYDLLKSDIRENLLSNQKGVLHIGAHLGQEAKEYSDKDLNVIWIEASEATFSKLERNIVHFKKQKALNFLLGDSNKHVEFYEASNDASSSIFRFGKDMPHKHLTMISTQKLKMQRLDSIFDEKQIERYKYWVIDVQGAELLVLKGAGDLLTIPTVIEIEISTREEYLNGAKYSDIDNLLTQYRFRPLWSPGKFSHENIFYVKLDMN